MVGRLYNIFFKFDIKGILLIIILGNKYKLGKWGCMVILDIGILVSY